MGVLEVSRSIGDGPYKNHGDRQLYFKKFLSIINASKKKKILKSHSLYDVFNLVHAIL